MATAQNLEEIIRDIDEKQRQIQTFSATFTQKKETSLATEPLLSSGRVHFKRPDRIHWSYLKPERAEVALEDRTFWVYLPDRSQAEKVSLSRKAGGVQTLEALTAIFKKTFNELTEGYTIYSEGLEEERLYHFRLQPKEEKDRKVLSRIDLWIDKSSGAILRFIMVEVNGDHLSLEFGDPQINPPLTDDQLKIRIPPAVRVREQSLP
jgi:outer membrane lipoprotein-sorting protein